MIISFIKLENLLFQGLMLVTGLDRIQIMIWNAKMTILFTIPHEQTLAV